MVALQNIAWFKELGKNSLPQVGGKGANLGEMYNLGLPIPPGFVVTAQAFQVYLSKTGLGKQIYEKLAMLNVEETAALQKLSKEIQGMILQVPMAVSLQEEILEAYDAMNVDASIRGTKAESLVRVGRDLPYVAVRSSATAEDLPEASFAGQQATYLNIKGRKRLIAAVMACWASLFTARAIYYREKNKFPHDKVLIAVVVQRMVNSEVAGIMFSVNPVNNNPEELLLEGSYGLGEAVVSGSITPDEFVVDKKSLELKDKKIAKKTWMLVRDSHRMETIKVDVPVDKQLIPVLSGFEVKKLAEFAVKIEQHYQKPQDIEFALERGRVYITQSRPITTLKKRPEAPSPEHTGGDIELKDANLLVSGLPASPGIAKGRVVIVHDLSELSNVKKGDVMVARMTTPDYVVAMERAVAIVTDAGGSTCHSAIVSREMGIPCFSGETMILTNKGFLSMKEVCQIIISGESLLTLSFNLDTLKTEWKVILNATMKSSQTITVSVSKKGQVKWNTLVTTPGHKFLTLRNRAPCYERIDKVLESDSIVYAASDIPQLGENFKLDFDKANVCGAVFSDGYLRVQADGTSNTTFVQKKTPEKENYIQSVRDSFLTTYNYSLRPVNSDYHHCYRKHITQDLLDLRARISTVCLGASNQLLLRFLASSIDGDGNFVDRGKVIKISFNARDLVFLQALAITCLRLGLSYRVRREDNQFRFYVGSGLGKIRSNLLRVSVDTSRRKKTGNFYLGARHLFLDIPVPGRKGIKSFVKNNCLISLRTIQERILPHVSPELHKGLDKILASDLSALRVQKVRDNDKEQQVFNIEVKDNNNYVVFTKLLTPLIVKNCVVGTEVATHKLKEGDYITVDALKGKVYEGNVAIQEKKEEKQLDLKTKIKVKVIMDLPDYAERAAATGADGVGLLRGEFINLRSREHPVHLIDTGRQEEFVENLVLNLKKVCKAFKGKPVWYRTLDAPTDEFRNMKGGESEPKEDNPMMGWRSIRRSLDQPALLKAEYEAVKRARTDGCDALGIMIPLVTHVEQVREAKKIFQEQTGLVPGKDIDFGVMIETPAAVQIIEELCKEGISFASIGTNDLTQFTLACDRNSAKVQKLYDPMHPAVLRQMKKVVKTCKRHGVPTSICGQAGSKPEMAKFLFEQGIHSISANPDAVYTIRKLIAKLEGTYPNGGGNGS